ncbi:MAG: class I SAM-dependent methyltransferase [Bacteroidia bacterium]
MPPANTTKSKSPTQLLSAICYLLSPKSAILLPIFLLLLASCSPPSSTLDDSAISPESGQLVLTTESDSAFEALEEMDHADRENWQKPQMVISRLGDLSDKVVADIGAGTGYFTMPLARKASKVIAIDIEQEFLDYIQRRLSHSPDRLSLNIETRLVKPEDPMLKTAEADLVLIVNTYAYSENRVAYFQKVFQGLKPDGRLVVIDFKKDPLPVGPPTEAKLDPSAVSLELDSAGFRTVTVDNSSLEYQYTLTAEKRRD